MAQAVKTVMTYPLTGGVDFNIPFEYLARKFVTVTLIGVDRKVLILNQDFRFTTKTTVTTTKAWVPSDGYTSIEIRRYTSATDRLVDFADGSILRAYDLNISQVQTLHVAEEARDLTADTIGVNNDGHLDARGRRIVNVANAVAPNDAITLGQVTTWNTSALNSAKAADVSQKAAKVSETNSKNSENLAQKWAANPVDTVVANNQYSAFHYSSKAIKAAADAALSQASALTASSNATTQAGLSKTSADASKASQNAAAGSATAAAGSAQTAKTEADRAKTEANKLENMNKLAGKLSYPSDIVTALDTQLHLTHGGQGLTLESDGSIASNLMAFWDTDSNARIGYIGFSTALNGSNRVVLHNDLIANSGGRNQTGYYSTTGIKDVSRIGGGAFANQYDQEAPFFHEYTSSSGSEYNPLIKQRIHSTYGTAWSTSWSLGTLVSGGAPDFRIFNLDSNGSARGWVFKNDGSLTVPGNLTLTGGAGTALFTTQGNISGNIFDSGSLNGEIRALVDYLQRGGQVYSAGSGNGSGRAVEAPAGCFMTGVNTNVSDGRGMGIYWRALQFRRRGGGLQNIGG